MDINYAVDAIILILEVHIILYGSQIVAQVLPTCGASSRKNPMLHLNFHKRSVTQKEI
jgi:hypothetical protein